MVRLAQGEINFGYQWLKFCLFGEGSPTDIIKEEAVKKAKAKAEEQAMNDYPEDEDSRNQKTLALFEQAVNDNKVPDSYMLKIYELDQFIKDEMSITFGNRIENQIKRFIPVFVAAGGNIDQAFDLLLERKVLRKFESRLNSRIISKLSDLELKIIELFGDNKLSRSLEYIERLRDMY